MHDLDRPLAESEYDGEQEQEFEFEDEYESDGEFESESEFEDEFEEAFEEEAQDEFESGGGDGLLGEVEEMELAAELLSAGSDQELEEFLGKLIKRVGRGVGKFARSGVGRSLGKLLKGVAKKALPMVAGAAGNFLLPGVGGAAGAALGNAAGKLFGLELEGMSGEDQEMEVARRFVRFAADAARRAAGARGPMDSGKLARAALAAAARTYAPGMLRQGSRRRHHRRGGPSNGSSNGSSNGRRMTQPRRMGGGSNGHAGQMSRAQGGRWVRRGRSIVLYGV